MRLISPWLLSVVAGCATPQAARPIALPAAAVTGDHGPRKTMLDFLDAAERRDFERVLALLAHELRQRYDATRLAHDFDADPRAQERLQRARAALSVEHALAEAGLTASLALDEQTHLSLVNEDGSWHVLTLEALSSGSD